MSFGNLRAANDGSEATPMICMRALWWSFRGYAAHVGLLPRKAKLEITRVEEKLKLSRRTRTLGEGGGNFC